MNTNSQNPLCPKTVFAIWKKPSTNYFHLEKTQFNRSKRNGRDLKILWKEGKVKWGVSNKGRSNLNEPGVINQRRGQVGNPHEMNSNQPVHKEASHSTQSGKLEQMKVSAPMHGNVNEFCNDGQLTIFCITRRTFISNQTIQCMSYKTTLVHIYTQFSVYINLTMAQFFINKNFLVFKKKTKNQP